MDVNTEKIISFTKCNSLIEKGELWYVIRQINNIDFLSEVSTVQQIVYTEKALLLDRQ